jgi:hypothetical protein
VERPQPPYPRLFDQEHAGPDRPHQPLVQARGVHGAARLGELVRKQADPVRSVNEERRLRFGKCGCDLFDRHKCAGQKSHLAEHDEACLRRDFREYLLRHHL